MLLFFLISMTESQNSLPSSAPHFFKELTSLTWWRNINVSVVRLLVGLILFHALAGLIFSIDSAYNLFTATEGNAKGFLGVLAVVGLLLVYLLLKSAHAIGSHLSWPQGVLSTLVILEVLIALSMAQGGVWLGAFGLFAVASLTGFALWNKGTVAYLQGRFGKQEDL